MDKEKYGIELDLILGKFKQKIQEVKNSFKGVSDKKINIDANTGFLEREFEIARNQVNQLKSQLARLKAQQEGLFDWQKDTDKARKLSNEINVVQIALDKAELKADKLAANLNKASKKGSDLKENIGGSTSKNLSKGIDKITNKVKRFGLALLSIRSIYALVSRASSAYLSQDTELANKLQSAWVGLGAILSPIITFITNLILKLVSVINGFIKTMTGVDLIAKASSKSMKSAAGSANALKKSLAGFDELNNLDSDTGGGAGGIGNWADAFADIDTNWAEMMKNIYNTIDTFKTNMVKKMRESIEEAKKTLKQAGFSDAFIDMYDFAANGSVAVLEGFVDSLEGILKIIDGILTGDKDKIMEGFKQLVKGLWDMVTGLAQVILGAIGMLVTGIVDLVVEGAKWIYNNVLVPIDSWVDDKIRKPIKSKIGDAINWVKNQFEGWKSNIRTFVNTVGGWFGSIGGNIKTGMSDAWNWLVEQFNGWKENVSTFVNTIGNFFSNLWKKILNGFANMWNKIANAVNKVGGTLGMPSVPTINSYAVGTNYVPEDQLAFIHKGEAVVPKKYNNGGYVPPSNNETNALLEQVITAINNIEINPYTTVKDVGKASLSYINNKSRQLGESVVV